MKKFITVIALLVTIFLTSSFNYNVLEGGEGHSIVDNADVVISFRIDTIYPSGLIQYESIMSFDSYSENKWGFFPVISAICDNGPGEIKKQKHQIDELLKKGLREY